MPRRLVFEVVAGFAIALAFGLMAGPFIEPGFGFEVGLVVALAIALLLASEHTTLVTPRDAEVPAATDPLGLLRDDAHRGLAVGIARGFVAAVFGGLVLDTLVRQPPVVS